MNLLSVNYRHEYYAAKTKVKKQFRGNPEEANFIDMAGKFQG